MSDDEWDEPPPAWPADGMIGDDLRAWVESEPEPIKEIVERPTVRRFDTSGTDFSKRHPVFRLGIGWADFDEQSRFVKRWFDFPDLGRRGWAIIFQSYPPPGEDCEIPQGWVPPEREADADRWIDFMNREVQRLLQVADAE